MNISVVEEIVFTYLQQNIHTTFKSKELAKILEIPQSDYRQFRILLRAMVQDGRIFRYKKGRYGLGEKLAQIVGNLHVKTMGYGFVSSEEGEDIFISQKNMGMALHGDVVRVRLFAESSGRKREGKIVEIIQRGRSNIVGIYRQGRKQSFVVPDELKLQRDILIPAGDTMGARNGQKVVVKIDYWEHENLNPVGQIVKILGQPNGPGVDVSAIAASYDLDSEFPTPVVAEVEALSGKLTARELKNRRDYRDWICFTIDPPDAKDFDDAVSLTKLPGGNWRLGVHIADVSHFISIDSALDQEALNRGASVYLVDRVIPMLPHKLSSDLCSLRPNLDRLCFSIVMELAPDGSILNYELAESVIHSRRRFSYEEVQDVIDGKRSDPLSATIMDMYRLSQHLLKKRRIRGAVEIDSLEVKIELDEQGRPIALKKRERLDSHRLIEEFMLCANQSVASFVGQVLAEREERELPFIYRVHEKPSKEKIAEFLRLLEAFSFNIAKPKKLSPRFFQRVVDQVEKSPVAFVVEDAMLRAMMKAAYSTANIGHFALAYRFYTHFTSPIRRYPDLVVHRLLKNYQNHGPQIYNEKKLAEICRLTSGREIVAQEAERESVKVKQVAFMAERVGQVYEGVISRVTHFGFFVDLPEQLVGGLVHVTDLSEDYYVFDENLFAMIGERTKKVYRLGDKLSVQLKQVDLDRRLIDFIPTPSRPQKTTRKSRRQPAKNVEKKKSRPSRPKPKSGPTPKAK